MISNRFSHGGTPTLSGVPPFLSLTLGGTSTLSEVPPFFFGLDFQLKLLYII